MYEWPHVEKKTVTGTIDDVLKIKASPGVVEISGGDEWSGWMIGIPSSAVDQLITRLSAARDAAALMASDK